MRKEQGLLEEKISALLGEKNQEAIALIYEHYAETIYGYILQIIPSSEVAQEALQDTFMKIWKNADKYDASKARLFTWFINIARNTAIDKIRSASYKQIKKTEGLEIASNLPSLYEESNVLDSGLQTVIQSLDKKHSILIDLAYFKGYTHKEIEKELNIPLGTVKTRIRGAIKHLRVKLANEFTQNLLPILFVFLTFPS